MKYNVGDIVLTKKPHVCGSIEWEITRVGAEIKAKCTGCSREIIVFKTIFDKKIKHVKIKQDQQNND